MTKTYIKGNDAIVAGALQSGMNGFFGYPITPATEIMEGFAKAYFADIKRVEAGKDKKYPDFKAFMQMESEIGAISAVLGGAASGKRVMTASSSPGMSLKMEGISYLVGCQLPAVLVNIMRGGPGLGNIGAEQSDYFQATKGGGHGDYKMIVMAPNSAQEMADYTATLFNLADKYCNPCMLLADGYLGQMKEAITLPEPNIDVYDKSGWAADGNIVGREKHIVNSVYLAHDALEAHENRLQEKFNKMKHEVRFEEYRTDDAETLVVSYGVVSRIAKDAVDKARDHGIKAGLLRPITLWPFPEEKVNDLAGKVNSMLSVELSFGQMVEDVRLAASGKCPVEFYGRCGGNLPTEDAIVEKIRGMM